MGHDGPTGFRMLTGCQRDPRDRGVTNTLGFISKFSVSTMESAKKSKKSN